MVVVLAASWSFSAARNCASREQAHYNMLLISRQFVF
jgi:hypothetical protein